MKHVDSMKGSVNENEIVTEGEFKLIDILEGTADEYFMMQARNDGLKAIGMRAKFENMTGQEPVVVFCFKHMESDLTFREFDQLTAPGVYENMSFNSVYAKLSTYGPVKIGMVVNAKQKENRKGKSYLHVMPRLTQGP